MTRLPTISEILSRYCGLYGVGVTVLLNPKNRRKSVSRCRRAVIHALRSERRMSLYEIRDVLNLRCHTSILLALRTPIEPPDAEPACCPNCGAVSAGKALIPPSSASTPQPLAVASARREASPPARGGLP